MNLCGTITPGRDRSEVLALHGKAVRDRKQVVGQG